MKVALTYLVLIGFLSEVAHKCDFYFVGNIHYRRRGHGVDQDDEAVIQGCKKGCFWNETYTDDGIPKCEKCKEITDEIVCLSHSTTCQWTKKGKCKSQSCPSLAKSRAILYADAGDAGDAGGGGEEPVPVPENPDGATFVLAAGINENNTRESQYRDQIRKEKECIEGSALEQKYNNLYWNDFSANYNHKFTFWNIEDRCVFPGSKAIGTPSATRPYSWEVTDNSTENSNRCKYVGYKFTADPGKAAVAPNPYTGDPGSAAVPPDPLLDTCLPNDCAGARTGLTTSSAVKTACLALSGCIYIQGGNSDGSLDVCEFPNAQSCTRSAVAGTPRWEGGKNNKAECEGPASDPTRCLYVRGPGAAGSGHGRDDKRDANGLSEGDTCVPKCGTTFVAGTNTRKDCEVLGCTYFGDDTGEDVDGLNRDQRPGLNLKTDEDQDLCPAANHPPTSTYASCGENETLEVTFTGNVDDDKEPCDDRIYDPGNPYSCSIESLTTEESCKNGHGIWTPPPKTCRLLPSVEFKKCEFLKKEAKGNEVYKNLSKHGGNRQPGTDKDKCVQDHYDELDTAKKENVTGWDGEIRELPSFLTLEDHERIYGYRQPEDYCQHVLDLALKEECQVPYDKSIAGCHGTITPNEVKSKDWTRKSIDIKAARSTCHRVYGCMYSKSNERCSVWAVWAFIFTIIIVIVVVVVGLGVGAIVLLPIIKKSSA